MVQCHKTAILINSGLVELAAVAPLDGCFLQAIRKDCLNHKPFSISGRFFCHSSWDSFSFFLLHPEPLYWLKDHCMQLKLGDVLRTKIKNHDILLPKTLCPFESFMVKHYNLLFTLWWAKVPKEIIF